MTKRNFSYILGNTHSKSGVSEFSRRFRNSCFTPSYRIGGGRIVDLLLEIIIGSSFVYDMYYQRIPNILIIAGYFILGLYTYVYRDGFYGVKQAVIGMTINAVLWLVIYMLKGVKAGDVKFIVMLTGFLSWSDGLKYSLIVLYAAAFMGIFKLLVEAAAGVRRGGVTRIRFMYPILAAYMIMIISMGGVVTG